MDAGILKEALFPPADYDRWVKLAEKALKGLSFEEALTSQTDDGIVIEPLYERGKGAKPLPRAQPGRPWRIIQRADDPDPARANRQLIDDIENGADGVALVFEGAQNAFGYGLPVGPDIIDRLFDNVDLDGLHIRIDAGPNSRASVEWLADYLRARRIDPKRTTFSLGIDPAATLASTGRLRMSIEALKASMPQSLANFFATGLPGIVLEADGRPYHNAGATEAQELGAMLSVAAGHLRMFEEARQPLVHAAPHIGFSIAADQDQFVTIAKLRALRLLWARLQDVCQIPPSPAVIHVESSMRMMVARDAETNILRTTIAAFAAAIGGADTVSVLPHTITHGLPDALARRLARNTQLILARESNLGFVTDPSAGSGGVEALTEALCEAAWNAFQALEREGGILKSLVSGHFQAQITEAREKRAALYREGKRVIVGTTAHALREEYPLTVLDAERKALSGDGAVHCEPLVFRRIDETVRDV
ncbi:methylmalonyl-CoA mutase family protein [Phyllobacterium leguminum]|uniref:Heterodimeric methylmalonyl-CoA mutase small subunit n=1 Tax=Phyllobacterium leguminum TaxID=314237 RepID=A0A318SUG0_9HYPH|nr:methylmalonyl-CoA mutase family protein [Phyllobacterium leguminum]PYE85313.1 heterodimeric methylmalonyl-CoA mutase small subunit [Phyllobacterium leguminum]